MNNKTTLAIAALVAGALLTTAATVLPNADAQSIHNNNQEDERYNNQRVNSSWQCGAGGDGQCQIAND